MSEDAGLRTELIAPAMLEGGSANLLIRSPAGVERAVPLRAPMVIIGRADSCDVAVKDPAMSSRHAEVVKESDSLRIRDLGSANGVWLNGERVDDAELFDGDVLRLGQTSIRIDLVGGRRRPAAGPSRRMLSALLAAALVLGAGVVGGLVLLRKRQQHRRDLATLAMVIESAREGQKARPCASALAFVGDVAQKLNGLGRPTCEARPGPDESKRAIAGFRELSRACDRIATQVEQFGAKEQAEAIQIARASERVGDPELRAQLGELQDLLEERGQVTVAFIADWRKLSLATGAYAAQLEKALVEGNEAACAAVEAGVGARGAPGILSTCNRGFERARSAVDEKLRQLEQLAAAGED